MTIAARLQQAQSTDKRGSPRRRLSLDLSLQATGHQVSIHDISSTGMLIETAAELVPFDDLEIDLPQAGITHAVVVWSSGAFFGCEFKETLSRASLSAVTLRSFPANAPQLQLPLAAEDGEALHERFAEQYADEEKAPLSVRLRVILGIAMVLWALILWVIFLLA
jgi:hypothetical protein